MRVPEPLLSSNSMMFAFPAAVIDGANVRLPDPGWAISKVIVPNPFVRDGVRAAEGLINRETAGRIIYVHDAAGNVPLSICRKATGSDENPTRIEAADPERIVATQ